MSVQHEIVPRPRRRRGLLPPDVQQLHGHAEPCGDAGEFHRLQHPGSGRFAAAEQRRHLGRLRDVNPDKFGQVDNYVTAADNFGGQTEVFNGVDFSANARMQRLSSFRGGISTGKVTQDVCDIVVDHPEVTVATITSHRWVAEQHDDVPRRDAVPDARQVVRDLRRADDRRGPRGDVPEPAGSARRVELHRDQRRHLAVARTPLSGGVANTTLNLVTPGSLYGERLNQLDLRFTKDFKFGPRSVRANFDIYNALNGNYVRTVNANYAAGSSDGDSGSAALQDQRAVRLLI